MHLLHVITSMDPVNGGPCQGIRNLDAAMRKTGVTREVVCFDPGDAGYLGGDHFTIHAIGAAIGPWKYNNKLIGWLKQNISRFDVIIVNGLWLYNSYGVWSAIKQLKKASTKIKIPPFFVMPHGMLDPYFQRAKERKFKAIRNLIYWKFIENKVINDADGLLFTCEAELLLARETFNNYHPKKEYNIGYGITQPPVYTQEIEEAFKNKCVGLEGPYLLFLSRIHQKKAVDLLLKSYINLYNDASLARTTIPKLVIAGPGIESNFGSQLISLVNSSAPISANVFFPGMLDGDAKWGAFYGAEAFVLPSHQENFGIVIAEALACCKPVLISNQVNTWREIKDGNAGLIADDTMQGIEGLLKQWFEMKEEEKEQMERNAFKTYQNHFMIEEIAKAYSTVFASYM